MRNTLRKLLAASMCLFMIITSAAVLPEIADIGITANAVGSSFENAMNIYTNQTYTDNISESTDVDYYTFTLYKDSVVNFEFSHSYIDSGSTYWDMYLYKNNDTYDKLYSESFVGNTKKTETLNIGLPKGTYYICVHGSDWSSYSKTSYRYSDIDYKLKVNASITSYWEKEENNFFETANYISTNQSYTASINANSDCDYYKFVLSANSKVNIEFSHEYFDSSSSYWDLQLYKDNNSYDQMFSQSFIGSDKNTITVSIGLPKGTYYICVHGSDWSSYSKTSYRYSDIDYKLKVNASSTSYWEKEDNNEFKTATAISLNNEYSGSLQDNNDIDYYIIIIPNTTNVTFTFKHGYIDSDSGYWECFIYKKNNSNDELEKNIILGNKTTDSHKINLQKGTYYICVHGSDWSSYSKTSYRYSTDDYKFSLSSGSSTSLKLNKTSVSLGKGESYKLTANRSVSWRTSNSNIVTVDKNGNVKAKNTGKAWVTARTSNGVEKSCTVTVKNAPSKITTTKSALTLGVGEKFSLTSSIPNGTACSKRTWRTSNSTVVKMTRTDWQGNFIALKPGVAYVTVRSYNGKESSCKVTVKKAPSKVTISRGAMTMKVGQTATLSAVVPDGTGCATRTFRTSNSTVVKMTKTNWTGSFKALKKGVAYVTVRTYNGKESSCKITVIK